jgi:hypothetical protein
MGHTGPRTIVPLLDYHIGRWNELFTWDGSKWTFHPERVDEKMARDLGDAVGNANAAYQQHYGIPSPPYPTSPDLPAPDWPIHDLGFMEWADYWRTGDPPPYDGPALDPRKVSVIAIQIPAAPAGGWTEPSLQFSVAEHRAAASIKQVSLSRIKGDFNPATYLSFQEGTRVGPSVLIGQNVQSGETIYASVRFYSRDLGGPSTGDEAQGVTMGGPWAK